ncbi:ATP-binding protein [Myxosarcina sp. GI1]|uniref:sensor histidine kinase n=1 Tax=Myxosarcina sp. GI1 TaxID=1541065 RepID=UPI000564EA69|nr:ATP-binding protein [Myxosarcina sp. GI1]
MNELAAIATHLIFGEAMSFMPHGMCYLWKPGLVGLHLISNGIIAVSYFSIPIVLVYILRQRTDIPFNGIFLLFAAFILFCGTGHAFDIWTLWHPNYWISGWIRLLTAFVSLATAIALTAKISQILDLPSPTQVNNINQQLQEKINKLNQQQAIIHQQEQFLRSIYNNVREAIFVVDVAADGIFRYRGFNSAAKRLTGVDNVENKTPLQILPAEAAATVEKRYKKCVTSKTSISYEECLPFQNCNTWWLTTLNPVEDETKNISRIIGTSLNITERKEAEQALAKLNEELEARVRQRTAQLEHTNSLLLATTATLEKRNQELDRFAYVTSHDLKAPLRAIAQLSEWIEEDLGDKLDDDIRHNMTLLRSRVCRLNNLIEGLLQYSRIGRIKSKPESVDVAKMLIEIIDSLDAPDNFQIQIQDNMPTFVTESIPLQQVFQNLISNAIEHSDRDKVKIAVSVRELVDCYEFAIADNGRGIDPKYHDRIFTIFQTLKARDIKESTGIGLAIVKKAVEDRGGKIEVESQVGVGTTFRFTWKKG